MARDFLTVSFKVPKWLPLALRLVAALFWVRGVLGRPASKQDAERIGAWLGRVIASERYLKIE